MNQIAKLLFKVWVERALGYFVANSTQLLTDMGTVITNGNSTTTYSNAIAAGGPIMDIAGMLASVKLNFQEATEKLAYILQGSQVQNGPGAGTITAPSGGIITNTSDLTNYNLLTGIYQILK
jgi:hypothetical protein